MFDVTKLPHQPLVFIDVETTGMSARDGKVIDLGAIRVENGAVVASMNQLLDPGQDIPPFITRLTGIDNDALRGQPQFADVVDRLSALLEGATFVAHNVGFDYSFLLQEYYRCGQRLQVDRFCTARLSRKLYPEHRRHNLDSLIARGGYRVENRHRAYDDAAVLVQFWQDALAARGADVYRIIDQILVRARPKPPTQHEHLPLVVY